MCEHPTSSFAYGLIMRAACVSTASEGPDQRRRSPEEQRVNRAEAGQDISKHRHGDGSNIQYSIFSSGGQKQRVAC